MIAQKGRGIPLNALNFQKKSLAFVDKTTGNAVRTSQANHVYFRFARSYEEYILWGIGLFSTKVLYFGVIILSKIIKAQAIFAFIHETTKLMLQCTALCGIEQAFKNGVLYALSIVDTLFCDLAQSFTPRAVFCIDIIGNEHQQALSPTSIKMVDIHPNLRANNEQAAKPVHKGSAPMAAFPLDKDALAALFFWFAMPAAIPYVHHQS